MTFETDELEQLLEKDWYLKWGDYFNSTPFEEQKYEDLLRMPEHIELRRHQKMKRKKKDEDI